MPHLLRCPEMCPIRLLMRSRINLRSIYRIRSPLLFSSGAVNLFFLFEFQLVQSTTTLYPSFLFELTQRICSAPDCSTPTSSSISILRGVKPLNELTVYKHVQQPTLPILSRRAFGSHGLFYHSPNRPMQVSSSSPRAQIRHVTNSHLHRAEDRYIKSVGRSQCFHLEASYLFDG